MPTEAEAIAAKESVQVVVRVRPLSPKELKDKRLNIVNVFEPDGYLVVLPVQDSRSKRRPGESKPKTFSYDGVFAQNTSQEDIYDKCSRPVVDSVLKGYNGTIFCYGQTGAGKTFTMEGELAEDSLRGIIPRTFDHLFCEIAASPNKTFLVRVAFIEIYNNQIKDLLNPKKNDSLDLHEDVIHGIHVKGLTMREVSNFEEIDSCLQSGKKVRHTGETRMNKHSSRSHSIFTIVVEQMKSGTEGEDLCVGKLNLVDLAGSERQRKTEAEGIRLVEATKINLSLSALGNVILSLSSGKHSHIPYRDSKLTRLLQDSLGGNTKTMMIANIGPADYNHEETLSTLRFASRAKRIENKPRINMDPKDAQLQKYQNEIKELQRRLKEREGLKPNEVPETEVVVVEKKVVRKGLSKEKVKRLKQRSKMQKQRLSEKRSLAMEQWDHITKAAEVKKREVEKTLQAKLETYEEQQKDFEKLRLRILKMENQLLEGGKVVDNARQTRYELEQKQSRLKQREVDRLTTLRRREENKMEQIRIQQEYSSQEQELADKATQLEQLRQSYEEILSEQDEFQAEFQREREELLQYTRDLNRKYLLLESILTYFVDPKDVQRALERCRWDEDTEEWHMEKLDFQSLIQVPRPISCRPALRRMPQCEYSRIAMTLGDRHPRYRTENLVFPMLPETERTTEDFLYQEGPV